MPHTSWPLFIYFVYSTLLSPFCLPLERDFVEALVRRVDHLHEPPHSHRVSLLHFAPETPRKTPEKKTDGRRSSGKRMKKGYRSMVWQAKGHRCRAPPSFKRPSDIMPSASKRKSSPSSAKPLTCRSRTQGLYIYVSMRVFVYLYVFSYFLLNIFQFLGFLRKIWRFRILRTSQKYIWHGFVQASWQTIIKISGLILSDDRNQRRNREELVMIGVRLTIERW